MLAVAAWILLVQISFALRDDTQSQADALVEQARRREDIRSPNAPPFRLTASFSFTGDDLEPVHGTYTETWVSNSKWKQETVVGDQRSIVVGVPGKQWVLIPQGFPRKATELPVVWTFLPLAPLKLDFESIHEYTAARLTAECVLTKPDLSELRSVFCFEKNTGLLLQRIFPEKRPRNVVSVSCSYGTYRKFGAYIFPREVVCFEDQHNSIRADVVGLSPELTSEESWFQPPPDAVEVPECKGRLVKPYLISSGFVFSAPDPDRVSWVQLWLMVDTKGRAQNVRALRSLGKSLQKRALIAAHALNFAPGTCNGQPMPMPVTVEVQAQ
jgi:hypothetical protein